VNNSVNQSPPGPPSAGVRPYSTAGGRELRLAARPPARFSSLPSEESVNHEQEPEGNTLLAQRYPFSGNSYFWRTAEWSPWREESQAALKLGLLPEIHVWVGLPDQNELLDFTTKFLPEQAAKEGLIWRTPPPQDFLWCGPVELPEGVIYKPDLDAIGFILDRIGKTNRC